MVLGGWVEWEKLKIRLNSARWSWKLAELGNNYQLLSCRVESSCQPLLQLLCPDLWNWVPKSVMIIQISLLESALYCVIQVWLCALTVLMDILDTKQSCLILLRRNTPHQQLSIHFGIHKENSGNDNSNRLFCYLSFQVGAHYASSQSMGGRILITSSLLDWVPR